MEWPAEASYLENQAHDTLRNALREALGRYRIELPLKSNKLGLPRSGSVQTSVVFELHLASSRNFVFLADEMKATYLYPRSAFLINLKARISFRQFCAADPLGPDNEVRTPLSLNKDAPISRALTQRAVLSPLPSSGGCTINMPGFDLR